MSSQHFLFTILILPACVTAFAQAPGIEWQKSLGGSSDDFSTSVQQTSDGGFIVGGNTLSNDGDVSGNHGGSDYWVVKMDAAGNIQWKKSLGGSGDEAINSIIQTSDGGYLLSGGSTSTDGDITESHGGEDYWIVKLDADGNITWQKSFGGSGGDEAWSCIQTQDGGFVIAGQTFSDDGDVTGFHGSSDCWVVRLDHLGNLVWEKTYGGSDIEFFFYNEIRQTNDAGYIFTSWTQSNNFDVSGNHGNIDAWVVKLDSSGNITWQKCLGGTSNDVLASIEELPNGNFITAGVTLSSDGNVLTNHGNQDCWILQLDQSGNILWQKSLGGTQDDEAFSIQQMTDKGFIVGGYSNSNDGDVSGVNGLWDYWLAKLDSTGNIMWQKPMGGDSTDYGWKIQATSDGGVIMIGFSKSNNDDVSGNHGGFDIWLVKLQGTTGIESETNSPSSLSLIPNPATDKFNLQLHASPGSLAEATISITNSLGKTVFQKNSSVINGNLTEAIPLDQKFSEGIYFVIVSSGGKQWTAPLVVEK